MRDEGISLDSLGIWQKVSSFLVSFMMGLGKEDVVVVGVGVSGVVSCGFFTGEEVSIFSSAILFSLF